MTDACLFGAMIRRVNKCGGKISGIIWAQGESDATSSKAPQYTDRMVAFIETIRKYCGNNELPFVMTQIGRSLAEEDLEAWNSIQQQQRCLPLSVSNCVVVPTIDLELDDLIHYSGVSQVRLGHRFAYAVQGLCEATEQYKPPIEIDGIDLSAGSLPRSSILTVRFKHVSGWLIAGSRPEGFELIDLQGFVISQLYKIELEGNTIILKILKTPEEVRCCALHYGYGANPYCNITDQADRSLPVFGPYVIVEHTEAPS